MLDKIPNIIVIISAVFSVISVITYYFINANKKLVQIIDMGIDDVSKADSVKEGFLKILHYSLGFIISMVIIFIIDIINGKNIGNNISYKYTKTQDIIYILFTILIAITIYLFGIGMTEIEKEIKLYLTEYDFNDSQINVSDIKVKIKNKLQSNSNKIDIAIVIISIIFCYIFKFDIYSIIMSISSIIIFYLNGILFTGYSRLLTKVKKIDKVLIKYENDNKITQREVKILWQNDLFICILRNKRKKGCVEVLPLSSVKSIQKYYN